MPCDEQGEAAGYACHEVDLLSKLAMEDYGATRTNDVWGWTDPSSGREYVLAAHSRAVSFVDITDPLNPQYLGYLPSHSGESSIWRDVKVWRNYAFVVVDGSGANGMQVFDLTELRSVTAPPVEFSETAHYDGVTRVHNVAISEDHGYAILVGSSSSSTHCPRGLHMVDILDPTDPVYAGCFRDMETGRGRNGYVHDVQCVVYKGPDADYSGREICFGSNETHLSIADVTDKGTPINIARADYPDVSYSHQGWLSEDHRYFFMNDEGDERRSGDSMSGTRMVIWDVMDLDDPVVHSEYFGPVLTIDHNLYVLGQDVYMANYTSGLRVVSFQNIASPFERASFDTHPDNDALSYAGAWSVYPYFSSGTVVVHSHPHGLFMLALESNSATIAESEELPTGFALSDAYPNPFNPTATLTLTLPSAAHADVRAYDLNGRELAVLANGVKAAGTHMLYFSGGDLPSGTYLVQAKAGNWRQTRSVTLLK